jgi:hypothetical protein
LPGRRSFYGQTVMIFRTPSYKIQRWLCDRLAHLSLKQGGSWLAGDAASGFHRACRPTGSIWIQLLIGLNRSHCRVSKK